MTQMLRERIRLGLERFILSLWYTPAGLARPAQSAARVALTPLSWLVAWMATRRRRRIHDSKQARRSRNGSRPAVVVVGNVVAGGTGKSPIVAAVARALNERGWRVGIVTRSYRAHATHPEPVTGASDPDLVGDEAVMLAQETRLPVMTGPRRAKALSRLVAEKSPLDIVLCDDGLQHEPLNRDLELAVLDSRGLGNGRCMPAGPLREPAAMLETMDAIICNRGVRVPACAATAVPPVQAWPVGRADQDAIGGGAGAGHHADPPTACHDHPSEHGHAALPAAVRVFDSRLVPDRFEALDGSMTWTIDEFVKRVGASTRIDAVAGIARPERFFRTLEMLGLPASNMARHALPDHATIDRAWLGNLSGQWIIVTAKDAVKCQPGPDSAGRLIVLRMRADLDGQLLNWLIDSVRARCGAAPAATPGFDASDQARRS